jgi:hypothetical protein
MNFFLLACLLAGNDNGVLFGSSAMMMGGAAAALIEDGASLQYNPGGLLVDGTKLDVSGNAFSLRLHTADAFLRTGDARASASATEIVSIPSATTFSRRLSDRFSFAAGIFAPRTSDYTLRSRLDLPNGETWIAALSETYSELRGSFGASYHPGMFSVGLAVDVVYFSEFSASMLGGGSQSDGENVIFTRTASSKTVALAARGGVVWRVWRGLRFGLTVSSPQVSLVRSVRADDVAGGADASSRVFSVTPTNELVADVRLAAPPSARLGIGWKGETFSVACDLVVSTPAPGRVWNINVIAGARGRVTKLISLGGGLFTDRSSYQPGASLARAAIDYYGANLSVEFLNRYERADNPRPIEFGTQIGLRYGFGIGKLSALEVPTTLAGDAAISDTGIQSHEIMFMLGSSLNL